MYFAVYRKENGIAISIQSKTESHISDFCERFGGPYIIVDENELYTKTREISDWCIDNYGHAYYPFYVY